MFAAPPSRTFAPYFGDGGLSPRVAVAVEGRDEVTRPAPRDGDHDVEAAIEADGGGMGAEPEVGGAGDPPRAPTA